MKASRHALLSVAPTATCFSSADAQPPPTPEVEGTRLSLRYGHPGDGSLPDKEKLFVLNAYPAGGGASSSRLAAVNPGEAGTLTLKRDPAPPPRVDVTAIGAGFDHGYFGEPGKEHHHNTRLPAAR